MRLSSRVIDIPEAEDKFLGTKDIQSTSLCHNYVIARQNFDGSRKGETWTVVARQEILLHKNDGLESAAEKVTDLSMFAVLPVLQSFSFVGAHSSVDVYAVLEHKPMHSLSLWLSKVLIISI